MKKICLFFLILLLLSGCQLESFSDDSFDALEIEQQNTLAKTTPFEPYGQLVEYKLAKLTGLNNMPNGDTYENNAITRYLKEKLNIQNKNVIELEEKQYSNAIDMYISSKKLPDIMLLDDYNDLVYLVENDMIADLTECYQNCTTDRIKDIYNSYGNTILDNVTFDNKIMALPDTNILSGPNLIWLRKDWMDLLSLEDPQSLDDVIYIIEQFITKDPGKNGVGNTIGLMVNPELVEDGGSGAQYLLDAVFASFQSYPKQWIYDENDNITYGSITDTTKNALEYLNELYEDGIIDANFVLRTTNNIYDEIVAGHCGSFFGPWWASNNPLVDAMKLNNEANWQCYLLPTDKDGSITYYSQRPSSKYVVVRKGFEYPEIIFKMISVQFDYLRFIDKTVEEINNYERNNVDQTARPLSINIDYANALMGSHHNIQSILDKTKSLDEIPILDASYAKACLDHINENVEFVAENWAAYSSRIEALSLFEENKINTKQSIFYGQTETMVSHWWKLEELENKTFIEIIMGQKDIKAFDEFRESWLKQGGKQIIKEIKQSISN